MDWGKEVSQKVKDARKRFVDAAVIVDGHTDYKIAFDPEDALAFVSRHESYNSCYREKLVALVEAVNNIVPRIKFGAKNPNTGRFHHHFRIGNEGSRVIYVEINPFYLEKLSAAQKAEMIRLIQYQGKLAEADESDVVESNDHSIIIRLWWD